MKIFGKELTFNGNKVYHAGNKPTASEIGAAASSHTHNYAGSSSAGGAANSALTATKATQDSAGQQINTTYIKGLSVSGKTITYTKGDGTTGTITTQDTNTTYSTGTASTSGLTKLYTGTGTATDGTMTQAAINTALSGKAASSHTHNYAGSSSAGGNANAAVKLSTARTINGTSFDGSANITTANWGTARNIQIGNTAKSVNGSANVTWSLSEIGAAAASHGRHMPDTCETITDWNNATKNGWYMGNNATNSPTANAWYFGEVIAHNANYVVQTVYQFTASTDAKAIPKYIRAKMNGTWGAWTNVTVAKAVPSNAVFTDTNTWRGVQDNLTSTAKDQSLSANQGKVLKGLIDGKAASSHTHNYAGSSSAGGAANSATKLATARNINGTNFDGTGNITTANWGTARTITIGNTGKSVNGSGNISWSLSEIGAAAASHTHNYIPTSTGSSISIHADSDSSSTGEYLLLKAGHNELKIASSAGGTTVTKGQDKLTFNGNVVYHTGKKPTASEIGAAASSHTHNYAGSSSAGGAANSATVLATARTINGTSFNGSANITTANWGTARTITIGNTGKSVNGSGNIAWSLSEIGAAPAGYGLGTVCQDKSSQDCNNILTTGFYMGSNMTNKPSGCTQGWIYLLVMKHNDSWVRQVAYDFGTASQVYTRVKQNGSWTSWVATDNNTWRGVQDNLTSSATDQSLSANQGKILKNLIDGKAASSHTHNYAGSSSAGGAANSANTLTTARTINGTSFNGSANITTANWGTARTITIGSTGKSVNGSGNVSWSLSEIGAAAASHSHSYLPLSGGTITGSLTIGDAVLSPYSYSAAKGLSISAIQVKLQGSYGINLNSNTAIAGTLDMTSNMTMGGTKFYIKSGTNYSASYFPQLTGSNIYNPFAQIILETDNSAGRFHFLNANGQPGICFSGGFTVKTTLAAYSTANLSNNKENAFDIINNFNIIEQNDSRVIVPNIQTCSNLNEDDNIETNYSKIEINNDGDAIITTNLNSMVALLIDCVKELKSEIDSLKENLPNSL